MIPETNTAIQGNQKILENRESSRLLNQSDNLEMDILQNLYFLQGKSRDLATPNDWYMAVAYTVRNRLMKNWIETIYDLERNRLKWVGYLSAEFLMGPHLGNALINLDLYKEVELAVEKLGLNFRTILDTEEEPGLGNGGLGRLAACYLDSMSTLKVSAIGYGIRYEFGLFDQRFRDGWQYEVTDKWLRYGNPWEIPRPELSFLVRMGGHTEQETDAEGKFQSRWIPDSILKGVAYDTPVPGYCNDKINLLRLWKSEAVESFDFESFNRGDYIKAVEEKIRSENIGKVLYPNDESEQGRRLRLSQQYFFVSCSIQDALRLHKLQGIPIEELSDALALQLNDTHPAIGVAELMRLLIDDHKLNWETAWKITQQTFAYTNHTLLPEALEKWPLSLFATLLPRHLEIIYEINNRFLEGVRQRFPGDDSRIRSLSIIDEEGERYVRMAHLACIGSHMVNGVSKLHAELLKHEVMSDFYQLDPSKFIGITNGVSPRRWMKLYSPALSSLICEEIGDGWITNMERELIKLEPLAENPEFRARWQAIKKSYKKDFAVQLSKIAGVEINSDSLFDVMVKRIHEYKRQHLNLLHIVHLYCKLKRDPGFPITPRTFIFGGKAAPGYHMAKLIIKMIHSVAEVVNKDQDVDGRIRVIFFPDFNVKNSEKIYRAADLSEQISMAGKEASGTGNMKFAINGALTIGTMDGANIEIMNSAGRENFFLFGSSVVDINQLRQRGYRPYSLYQSDEELREVIDRLGSGEFSTGDKNLFRPIIDSLLGSDPYFLLQDFRSYINCQNEVAETFIDSDRWTRMSILNVARMGKFSSDRSIREYCDQIWKIKPRQ
jgi:starch phosphorylase